MLPGYRTRISDHLGAGLSACALAAIAACLIPSLLPNGYFISPLAIAAVLNWEYTWTRVARE
jgi:hypothetical protein